VSLFFSNCWNLFGQNLCIHSWTGIVLGHGYENYILPWYTCSMSATKLNDITQRYPVIPYRVGRENLPNIRACRKLRMGCFDCFSSLAIVVVSVC
jgi:hypothetical protein